jgi:hypothetical protein
VRGERLTTSFSVKRRYFLLLVPVAITLCLSQVALAQSGRRIRRVSSPTPAPVATQSKIDPPPPAIEPSVPINAVIVGGEIVTDSYFRSNYLDKAFKAGMERLKEHQVLNVTKGGKMTYEEAISRAKKETDAYILWLQFRAVHSDWYKMKVCIVSYFVFTPKTAKILIAGEVDPNNQIIRVGQVRIPTAPRQTDLREQMEEGAREVANRIRRKIS